MATFVGIDLGTTNSAVCTYDGTDVRVWKSPEQNDVTPSVIYYDRRGNRFVGKRAYDMEPQNPDNAAKLFKRLMGTKTPVKFSGVDKVLSPEECSAEILRTLFGYLPEELREGSSAGTVITVPAAFNQMQKDATLDAAEKAGIGAVALMQEPVAAVMSVMQATNSDGMFLVYDLGGGTLDIAIAESISGRVSLLAHGGIAVCGGRDFDRVLLDNVIKPWLQDNFSLPEDVSVNPEYKSLMRMAAWAGERAKIELSASEQAVISLTEAEIRTRDANGEELYLDIPVSRETLDGLIESRVEETIQAARETLEKAHLSPADLERVVFVGGPTNYKPLRDKVAFELGIPGSTEVNPMTAVATGAAIFAESVDWSNAKRGRKQSRSSVGNANAGEVQFNYVARTPDNTAKVVVVLENGVVGGEFQIDSLDTGWSSGRIPLANGASITLALQAKGENTFKVFAFGADGTNIKLPTDRIVIVRTAASVDAIPASHSVGVEVLDDSGHATKLAFLARAGDQLPKSGDLRLKTAESLKAGSMASLNFKLWEGEISDPVEDNRFIGLFKIAGSDFDQGIIPNGADIDFHYEVSDSGNLAVEVSIPSIGASFRSGHNFYSRQEGELDLTRAGSLVFDELSTMDSRLEDIEGAIDPGQLDGVRSKLDVARLTNKGDPESVQEGVEAIQEAKRRLAEVRKKNLPQMRKAELDSLMDIFNDGLKENAKTSEITAIENMFRTAQRAVDRTSNREFESIIAEVKHRLFDILWRQDWFVVQRFKQAVDSPQNYGDPGAYRQLVAEGTQALQSDDMDALRRVVAHLSQIQLSGASETDLIAGVNIMAG